jgi:hypothetical protein
LPVNPQVTFSVFQQALRELASNDAQNRRSFTVITTNCKTCPPHRKLDDHPRNLSLISTIDRVNRSERLARHRVHARHLATLVYDLSAKKQRVCGSCSHSIFFARHASVQQSRTLSDLFIRFTDTFKPNIIRNFESSTRPLNSRDSGKMNGPGEFALTETRMLRGIVVPT